MCRGKKVWGSIPRDVKKGAEKRQMEKLDHWDEKEIEGLLKTSGFRLKWLQKSLPGNSHLLLFAVKEK
jgi:hypothetical protein